MIDNLERALLAWGAWVQEREELAQTQPNAVLWGDVGGLRAAVGRAVRRTPVELLAGRLTQHAALHPEEAILDKLIDDMPELRKEIIRARYTGAARGVLSDPVVGGRLGLSRAAVAKERYRALGWLEARLGVQRTDKRQSTG